MKNYSIKLMDIIVVLILLAIAVLVFTGLCGDSKEGFYGGYYPYYGYGYRYPYYGYGGHYGGYYGSYYGGYSPWYNWLWTSSWWPWY